MTELKGDLDLLKEYRNEVAGRVIRYKANTAYWRMMEKKAKVNTQGAVDARNNIATNEHNDKLDRDFLKVIDKMIADYKPEDQK